jgi:hypothetical protein
MTDKEFLAEMKTHEAFDVKVLPNRRYWVIKTLDLSGKYYHIMSILSAEEVKKMTAEQLGIMLTEFLLQRCFS